MGDTPGGLQSRGLVRFSVKRRCHFARPLTENTDLTPFRQTLLPSWGTRPVGLNAAWCRSYTYGIRRLLGTHRLACPELGERWLWPSVKPPVNRVRTGAVPEQIDHSILVVRGHKVLLDEQLASFYGVEARALVQAVKRNISRFPEDFMLRLDADEWAALRPQLAASSLRSQSVILKMGRGQHRKYLPYAFTEQGVAMLSSVLRSPRAIEVNIQIMRAFVRLRQLLSVHKELAQHLTKLEEQMRSATTRPRSSSSGCFRCWISFCSPPIHHANRSASVSRSKVGTMLAGTSRSRR